MAYSKDAVEKITLMFFARRGMLPVGTTAANWRSVTMKSFQFDDPPITNDPHFVKRKIAQELQTMFGEVGMEVRSPLGILKGATKTLGDLVDFLYANKAEVKPLQ
ncbi:MAG: hypothetical protein AB7Q00_08050 [Phycisphaerales bacterium]